VILVDTSVWIELLRRRIRVDGETLLEVVTCGPVLQEVLQGIVAEGAAEEQLRAPFRDALLALPRLDDPLPIEAFLEAAEIYRMARRKGYSIRSGVDCLIAAIALRHDIPVWHRDRDFETISRFTALRTRKTARPH
jgi:predicted nucleic acid-binding protein